MPSWIPGHTKFDVLINRPPELFELCFRQQLFGFGQADLVINRESLIPHLDIGLDSSDGSVVVIDGLD
jgi:hypothetical protein